MEPAVRTETEYSQVYSVKRFVEVGGFKSVKFCRKTLHFNRQPINGLVAEGKRPTATTGSRLRVKG